MNRFTLYLKCCLKKSVGYIAYTAIFTFLICIALFVLLSYVSELDDDNEGLTSKIGVGMVGDTDDKYLQIGMGAVKSIDATKNYLDIIVYDNESEALAAMKSNKITGYLSVPDGFVRNVLKGKNTPAQFIAKNSPVDLAPMLMNDVISTVSNLVVESQVGIFAMENFYEENDLSGKSKAMRDINTRYISFVLLRDELVNVEEIGMVSGTVSLTHYYFCAFLIVAILLIGVIAVNFAVKTDLALPRLLSSRGTKSYTQVICEYICFAAIYVVTVLIIAVLCSIGILIFSQDNALDLTAVLLFTLKLIPVIFMLSSLQFFLYELTNSVISATLLQFVVSMGLCYLSGCFYPNSFFPDGLKAFAFRLPIGMAFEFLKRIAGGSTELTYIIPCIFVTLLLVMASSLIRAFKIRSRMS